MLKALFQTAQLLCAQVVAPRQEQITHAFDVLDHHSVGFAHYRPTEIVGLFIDKSGDAKSAKQDGHVRTVSSPAAQ